MPNALRTALNARKSGTIKEMDATAIITTTITAIASVVIAVSNTYINSQRKKDKEEATELAERNAAKSAILNMMTQDVIRAELLHKMPENHKAILEEYDKYKKNGGNSYVRAKIADYEEWYIGYSSKGKLTKNK